MDTKKTATFSCPHCSILSLHTALSETETKKEQIRTPDESPLLAREFITVHVILECVACKGETYCLIRYEKNPERNPFQIFVQAEWSEALGNGMGSILYRHPPFSFKAHRFWVPLFLRLPVKSPGFRAAVSVHGPDCR